MDVLPLDRKTAESKAYCDTESQVKGQSTTNQLKQKLDQVKDL